MPEEIKFARESWGKWHRVTEVSPGRFYPIGKTACGRFITCQETRKARSLYTVIGECRTKACQNDA